jgi:hypothetical protein
VCQRHAKNDHPRAHDAFDLALIETKLNTRPRKTLGCKTPAEVFGVNGRRKLTTRRRTQVPFGDQCSRALDNRRARRASSMIRSELRRSARGTQTRERSSN